MEPNSFTPFDNMTQTRELQMVKTAIPYAMLNDLRKFCTDKELETLDMITNMVSMMETYETIFA